MFDYITYINDYESVLCFLFKQQTAYEMRISDWSSDVCSSELRGYRPPPAPAEPERAAGGGRRRRRDRHVRGPGRRAALPGARTAREAEAHGQDPARAVRPARGRDARGGQPR